MTPGEIRDAANGPWEPGTMEVSPDLGPTAVRLCSPGTTLVVNPTLPDGTWRLFLPEPHTPC